MYRSLIALNRPTRHWLIQALSVPKRIGQASVTLAFDFLAANIARDTLMGWVMSRHGFKPAIDSARGMVSRLATDPNYRDFIANGGGLTSYLVDERAFKKHIERFYRRRGINYRTVIDSPAKLFLALERFADAFEMATRLGEYRRAIGKGEQLRHAAYAAREVSTDFAMRGNSAVLWAFYDSVIFLKAGINGLDRLYRGLAHDPNRARIAAKAGTIAALSMLLYAYNRGNPVYEDLEDWDRDTHWHFFIPKDSAFEAWARGQIPGAEDFWHFRYPKIWEVGGLASLAERTLQRFLDGQLGELAEDTRRILVDLIRLDFIPQAIAPAYEVATNRIRFLDRPIETAAMEERLPWTRAGAGTSRTMRAFGEAERTLPTEFQASPAQVEALFRGYLNTWALYGLTLSDAVFFDDTPSLRIDQYPVVRRFYQETPTRHTRYVTEFYDLLEAATQTRRSMRWADRSFRPEFATELELSPDNLRYTQLSRANRQMQGINREIRLVLDAPGLATVQQYA